MIDFLTFVLGEITMTAARKTKLKNAFAKQVGWTAKVMDDDGKEIDNPVSFADAFDSGVTEYIRGTAVAGQQQLDKEEAEATDDFSELVE